MREDCPWKVKNFLLIDRRFSAVEIQTTQIDALNFTEGIGIFYKRKEEAILHKIEL